MKILKIGISTCILMIVMIVSTMPVSANNDVNFSIGSVSYTPSEPSEGDEVIFTVFVGAENTNGGYHPNLAIYVDGGLQNMAMVTEFNTNYQLSIYWTSGDSHKVTIKVDPENLYSESNENDNKWEQVIESEEESISVVNLYSNQEPLSFPLPLTSPTETSSSNDIPIMEIEMPLDTDCDGYSDEIEISEGSDPYDPTSYPESSSSQSSDSAESQQSTRAAMLL